MEVALRLADTLNIRLRPNLVGQLKPGVRIVSHGFGTGDGNP